MEKEDRDVLRDALRNVFTFMVIALSCAALVLSVYAIYTNFQTVERSAQRAEATHSALCSFKLDLEGRRDRAIEFLRDNPGGIPGIPAPIIQRSIDSQNATLESLRSLECPSTESR